MRYYYLQYLSQHHFSVRLFDFKFENQGQYYFQHSSISVAFYFYRPWADVFRMLTKYSAFVKLVCPVTGSSSHLGMIWSLFRSLGVKIWVTDFIHEVGLCSYVNVCFVSEIRFVNEIPSITSVL